MSTRGFEPPHLAAAGPKPAVSTIPPRGHKGAEARASFVNLGVVNIALSEVPTVIEVASLVVHEPLACLPLHYRAFQRRRKAGEPPEAVRFTARRRNGSHWNRTSDLYRVKVAFYL